MEKLNVPPDYDGYGITDIESTLYLALDGGPGRQRLDMLDGNRLVNVGWTTRKNFAYLRDFYRGYLGRNCEPFQIDLYSADGILKTYVAHFVSFRPITSQNVIAAQLEIEARDDEATYWPETPSMGWDANHLHSPSVNFTLTLSNSNRDLSFDNPLGVSAGSQTRTVMYHTTGKWYGEISVLSKGSNFVDTIIFGIVNESGMPNRVGPGVDSTDDYSIGYSQDSGYVLFKGGAQASLSKWEGAGACVGIAVDLDIRKIWFILNNVNQTGMPGVDGGLSIPNSIVNKIYLCTGHDSGSNNETHLYHTVRGNFQASQMIGAIPNGFEAWG